MVKRLQLPLERADWDMLVAGDDILLSGTVYTVRDATLRYLEEIRQGQEKIPVELRDQVVFFAGPTPAPPGRDHGSIGPTTAARMIAFFPLLSELGVAAIIGKGPLGSEGNGAAMAGGLVYLAAIGGAGAYYSTKVSALVPVGLESLGPESIFRVELEGFPVVVVLDHEGGDLMSEEMGKYGRGR